MNQFSRIIYIVLVVAFLLSCSSEGKEVQPADVYAVELAVMNSATAANESKLTNLMYVFHNQSETSDAIVQTMTGEQALRSLNEQRVIQLNDKLEVGKYHVSVMAWAGNRMMSEKEIALLKKPYAEAVCQVDPRTQFYFGSTTFEVKEDNASKVDLSLSAMMQPYVFKLSDVDSIPNEAEVQISVTVRNLPQAFYLKDKTTLTNEEELALNISRFKTVNEIDSKPNTEIFCNCFLLDNKNLAEAGAERGTLSVVCQIAQNVNPKITSKIVNEIFPSTSLGSRHSYVAKIYSTDAPIRE